MKKIILNISMLIATLGFTLSSCHKSDPTPTPAATSTSAQVDDENTQSTTVNDNNNTNASVDLAFNDVNNLTGAPGARLDADSNDFTVVTNTSTSTAPGVSKTIQITYNKTNRFLRERSGTITMTLMSGEHFKDAGATWTVSFSGYSIKKIGDNDSNVVVLDGVHYVTNVNGGLISQVINKGLASVVHQVTGNMTLTFGSGKSRDWQISRKITYSNTDGVIGYMREGTGSADGYSQLSEWGTNRFGLKFYTSITTPIQSDTHCGLYKPFAGVREHYLISADNTVKIHTTETITKDDSNCNTSYTITFTNRKGEVKTKKISFN